MVNASKKVFKALFLIFTLFSLFGCGEKTYTITLEEGMVIDVENPQQVKKGTLVTVAVALPDGKEIDELLINGVKVDVITNVYSFVVTGNTKITATFKDIEVYYSLSLGEGITADVSNLNKILKDTEVTLSFNILEGQEIDKLIVNDREIILTEDSYSFFITEHTIIDLLLKDKKKFYTLNIEGDIDVDIDDYSNIQQNTYITLTVYVPEYKYIDYLLINNEQVTLTNNTYSFYINENTDVSVVYASVTYSVTGTPEMSYDVSDSSSIEALTEVSVTITPPEGKLVDYVLINGEIFYISENYFSFQIISNTTLGVVYTNQTFTIEIPSDVSTNIEDLLNVLYNTDVLFTIDIPEGQEVKEVKVNGEVLEITENTFSLNVKSNIVVEVLYENITYSLSLPNNITANVEDVNSVNYAFLVTLTIDIPVGHKIDGLIINDEIIALNDNIYSFKIFNDTTVSVTFIPLTFSLSIDPYLIVDIDELNEVSYGTEVTITAGSPPNKGLEKLFVNEIEVELVDNKYTFIMKQNTDVYATYYNVHILKLPEYVTADIDDLNNIKDNTLVTLTINNPANTEIESLLINNQPVTITDGTYQFNITAYTEPVLILKYFYKLTLGENVSSNISNTNKILKDDEVVLTVDVPQGKSLMLFKVNDEEVELINNTYTFNIKEDTTITAVFKNYYRLTLPEFVSSNISDLNIVYEGYNVVLMIEELENKVVTSFKVNDIEVDLINNTYEFIMIEDTTITVAYENVYTLTLPDNVTANIDDLNNIINGTLITLTVHLNSNEGLVYFKVNNQIVELDNYKYSFNITSNTVVEIDVTEYYSLTLPEGITANISDLSAIENGTEVILTVSLDDEKHLKDLYVNDEVVKTFSTYYKFIINEDTNITFTYYDKALLNDVLDFLLTVDKTFIKEGVFKFEMNKFDDDDYEHNLMLFDFDNKLNIIKGMISNHQNYNDEERFNNTYFADDLIFYEYYKIINDVIKDYDSGYHFNMFNSFVIEMGEVLFSVPYEFLPRGAFSLNDFIYELLKEYLPILKESYNKTLKEDIKFYAEDDDIIIVYKGKIKDIYKLLSMFDHIDINQADEIKGDEYLIEAEFLFTNKEFVRLKIYYSEDLEDLCEYHIFEIGYFNDVISLIDEFYEGDVNDLDGKVYHFHFSDDEVLSLYIDKDMLVEIDEFEDITPYKKGHQVTGYYTDINYVNILKEEDLVDGVNIYIKWEEIKTVNELVEEYFIHEDVFVIINEQTDAFYMESDKYIYYNPGTDDILFLYDKQADKYYRVTMVNDEMVAFLDSDGTFDLRSVKDHLLDDNHFNGTIKAAHFDVSLLVLIYEDYIYISGASPFGIDGGYYYSEFVVDEGNFNMSLDSILNNIKEDEIFDLEFYYEHHYYDIHNVADDVLFNVLYYSGIVKVHSLRELKEEYNLLDYILPTEGNDYTLFIIIEGNEMAMSDFVYFDGGLGKVLVYDDVFYYLEQMADLPEVVLGEFEVLLSYKVNDFYFNNLAELKSYITDDKVLYLKPGNVGYINIEQMKDIFTSYKWLKLTGDEFTAYYDFDLNIFYVTHYEELMYFEFNEQEVVFIHEDFKVVIPNYLFNKESFGNDLLTNWIYRDVFYHIYTIYYELNNITPNENKGYYKFKDLYINVNEGEISLETQYQIWFYSKLTFNDDELELDFDFNYNYELVVNNNITSSIYYYFNYTYQKYNYNFLNTFLKDIYNYDDEIMYDDIFNFDQFYEQDKITVYALYEELLSVDECLAYYNSLSQYVLKDNNENIIIKVDNENGIEFYKVVEGELHIFGYVDSDGQKYRINDGKLYLTDDKLLFDIVKFFKEASAGKFYNDFETTYSYDHGNEVIFIDVKSFDIEILFYNENLHLRFDYAEVDFINADFSEYEIADEAISGLEIRNNGLIHIDGYLYSTYFNVIYNSGLIKKVDLGTLRNEYDIDFNYTKYETTITIYIKEDEYTFKLDDVNNFVYDNEYGLLFIFGNKVLIYEDDLVSSGVLPEVEIEDELYNFNGWHYEYNTISNLEELFNYTSHYDEYVHIEIIYSIVSYNEIINKFTNSPYIVLNNDEYTAYYNFNENYFYVNSNEGFIYFMFNDDEIIIEALNIKYILPKQMFNLDSFLDEISHQWYVKEIFHSLYTIYDELNNQTPNKIGDVYSFDNLILRLEQGELYINPHAGFHMGSIISYKDDEPDFITSYSYEYKLIIDNDFTNSIIYSFNDMYYFYEYEFLNSMLEGVYNYKLNEVNYNSHFHYGQFYDVSEIRVYASYEVLEDFDYYLDIYKTTEKYVLKDMFQGFTFKINQNVQTDIYHNEEFYGVIDLNNNKYLLKDNSLYLTDNIVMFDFVSFFLNVTQSDFSYIGYHNYRYDGPNYTLTININENYIDLYFNNNTYLKFYYYLEEFTSVDYSSYDILSEELVDIKISTTNMAFINYNYYEEELKFDLIYNSGNVDIIAYEDLPYMSSFSSSEYDTVINITFLGDEVTLTLSDYGVYIYKESYGTVFSFDNQVFLTKNRLASIGALPVVDPPNAYYELIGYLYNGYLISYDDLFNGDFNNLTYTFNAEFQITNYDGLKEVFDEHNYLVLKSDEVTAYYKLDENYFYVDTDEGMYYFMFDIDEFIYQNEDIKASIPIEKFDVDSFKDNMISNWTLRYSFEAFYQIYYSFNYLTPIVEYNQLIYDEFTVYINDDELYINIYGYNLKVLYSEENLLYDELLLFDYNYELTVNNNISNSILIYTNNNEFYYEYNFLKTYLVGVYNYDINDEVDYNSLFYSDQFNSNSSIKVFGLYEELYDAGYYIDHYLNTDKYVLTNIYKGIELRINTTTNIIDVYDKYDDIPLGYIDIDANLKYRLTDGKLYETDDRSFINFISIFSGALIDEFIPFGNYEYQYNDGEIRININVKNFNVELVYLDSYEWHNFEYEEKDFTNFDFSEYEIMTEEEVDIVLHINKGTYFENIHMNEYVKFKIVYDSLREKVITYETLISLYDVELTIEKYDTIFKVLFNGELKTLKLSDYDAMMYNTGHGTLYFFNNNQFIYKEDLKVMGDIPYSPPEFFNVMNWKDDNNSITTFEEMIDDELYNYNEVYSFNVTLKVKEIDDLIDSLSDVLYIEGVKYKGYYDKNKDLFMSSDGVYTTFDEDDIIIYSSDFYVKFNVYEIDIQKGEDNFFNKEDFILLLEFRRLINKDFYVKSSSGTQYYLTIGFLDVYYESLRLYSSNELMIKTTTLGELEDIVLDDYLYQLTLKTHREISGETIYVIINTNDLAELDDLNYWGTSIMAFINHLTEEGLNDGNNPVDFDVLEPGIYNFFLNI